MDFVEKKEEIAIMIEKFAMKELEKEELIEKLKELSNDSDFNKELFKTVFKEIIDYVEELSGKELRQRALMIRSYME